ncbi:MAG: 5-methyltetrahydropteroyltriglutamate--homocysteine S-methyltransferase [Dehalococcoidia bacterium]
MVLSTNLGYPRIGPNRELKRALERYWSGRGSLKELDTTSRDLRRARWQLQKDAGLDHVPSNDFSLYDHVLDAAAMVGAVPSRFNWAGDKVDLDTYFTMARGADRMAAMEMTKWFDTNYHYIVPEFEKGQKFHLASTKPVDEFLEAKGHDIHTRPVLLGPVSFLLLGKSQSGATEPLGLLEKLLPVYEEVLGRLAEAGADWVQMDEPCLVLDLSDDRRAAFATAYESLRRSAPSLKLLVATYFGDLRDNMETAMRLPVNALHLDLVRGPGQLEDALARLPEDMALSMGVVDGRNVWITDLERAASALTRAVDSLGPDRVMAGPSCSLLHVPVDLDSEPDLDADLRSWLAFARQKVSEIVLLTRAAESGMDSVQDELKAHREVLERREQSTRINNPEVRKRLHAVTDDMAQRRSPFGERISAQLSHLNLPSLPTTTIGSFPQTPEVRKARAQFNSGKLSREDYEKFLEDEIAGVIRFQEDLGLDVLVHGEPERTDMVEYFGDQLEGFAVTANGWVQSYGSRCVRPPVIYGDVSRPHAMTTRWSKYAQSLTDKPVKGMLTGPITILQWSFVRDDQPRPETANQIALAIRDEVLDLEAAGIRVIQIDEPALREGLPLRREDWKEYLDWSVRAFRLASSGVRDETQIHTHMCYAEFNDIIEAIAALDADVISVEASRSQMELLKSFADFHYPNHIGPGVYDIHSPRVPDKDEVTQLLDYALQVIPADQVWVNPDCGLKTRRWEEVKPSLSNMAKAAVEMREKVPAK